MSYSVRRRRRDWRRGGSASPGRAVETLEGRTLLSGAGSSLAAPQAHVSSATVLLQSLKTAVTGARVTFTADIENAATGAPILSGKVDFEVEAPRAFDLGKVSVNKQGQANITTGKFSDIADYVIKAVYIPGNSSVSPSASTPATLKVIPLPHHVPTAITVVSGAPLAETGQHVPLFAAVKDAGSGDQVDAGKVATIAGTIDFVTVSPHPVVLAKVPLNLDLGQNNSVSNLNVLSIFGITSTPTTVNVKDEVSISTNMLKDIGTHQVEAKFVPANKDFAASTSAPVTVRITPKTRNDPTITTLRTQTNSVETGVAVALNMTVQDANSSLAGGTVKFTTVGPHPVVLGKVAVSTFDQPVSLATDNLQSVGTHQIQAVYTPSTDRFAKSTSAPVTITVTPLTAASFAVTPEVRHTTLNEPVTFTVTALDAQGQRLSNYTGTVVITSPTDSSTILPNSVYASLHIAAPSPDTAGLAGFTTQQYTFTPADHGSHTFVGGVTFEKGGVEVLKVAQANDAIVQGRASISIA